MTTSTGTVPTTNAVKRVSGISVGGSRANMNFGSLMQAYSALPMTAKATWQQVANTLNLQQGRVGRHKLTASNAYCILGSGNLAIGMPLPTNAPASIAPPPYLPKAVALSATYASSAEDAPGTDTFSLMLTSPSLYNCNIQVQAAAPNPGKSLYPDGDFSPLVVLAAIPADGIDLASFYAAQFGPVEMGAQVALKLVAINAAGVRLSPLLVCATVTPADMTPLRRAA